MKQIKYMIMVVLLGSSASLTGQVTEKKWANVMGLSASPSWSTAWITGYQPDVKGGYTEAQLRDSFALTDRSLQTKNFSVTYSRKLKASSNLFIQGLKV